MVHEVADFLADGSLDCHRLLIQPVQQLARGGACVKIGHLLLQHRCQICMPHTVGLPHTYTTMKTSIPLCLAWSTKAYNNPLEQYIIDMNHSPLAAFQQVHGCHTVSRVSCLHGSVEAVATACAP